MKDALIDIATGLIYLLMALGIIAIIAYTTKIDITDDCQIDCRNDGYEKSVMIDNVCWCLVKYEIDEQSQRYR
jgi:hypothetical protein